MQIKPVVVEGDLLDQQVEVIVNPWNRNVIPWWLLIPQGVSGAIKRQAGYQPFIELGQFGAIPLGAAVLTSAGRLSQRGIIHVAGIDLLWRSTAESIKRSVVSAMDIVNAHGFQSVAFPIIGAGTGGFGEDGALTLMQEASTGVESAAKVVFVRFRKK